MRLVKHFGIRSKNIYLGGFYVIINHQAIDFLGKEHAIGILFPFQKFREGLVPKGIRWSRRIKPPVV